MIHAPTLFAKLCPQTSRIEPTPRGTAPFDDLSAYLSGITPRAMAWGLRVYALDITMHEPALRAVLDEIADRGEWQPIGKNPRTRQQRDSYRRKNAGLIRKLTELVIREEEWRTQTDMQGRAEPWAGRSHKARAKRFGVSESCWHRDYKQRFNMILEVADDFDHEIRSRVNRNQIDPARLDTA